MTKNNNKNKYIQYYVIYTKSDLQPFFFIKKRRWYDTLT